MIKRYSTPEMTELWSDLNKFKLWALVEATVLRARSISGELCIKVPPDLPDSLKIDPEEIDRIEKAGVGHDVIAFLMHTSPQLPEDLRPWWHHKLTSYDPQDTALMLQLQRSVDLLDESLRDCMNALKERAFEHKLTPMIGRTHLVHAEPITFGVKLANWFDECSRHRERFRELRRRVSVGKLSGAVGMYTLPPDVEERVCAMLGLVPVTATQIIARDVIADYVHTLSLVGGTLEKIAVAIRLLQSTEVREVQEHFDPAKQRGSSAMPHKRNPIASENISGLVRMLRGYSVAAAEDQQTWHERSLDNSGVERIFLPDASQLAHFMLRRMTSVIRTLQVYPEKMLANLRLTRGLIFSQNVQALVAEKSGLPREEAYGLVHRIAQQCWESGDDFYEALLKEPSIRERVLPEQLKRCFNFESSLKYVDHIFNKVFNQPPF